MFNWKHSIYNINLKEDGYQNAKENEYYNTLMGKFAVIPDDVDLDNPPEELKGFLVPIDVNESENYANAQKKLIENDYPEKQTFVIAVTTKCNYRCVYCFEENCIEKGISMSPETVQDTINYITKEIDRNTNIKSLHIEWFGGETLMAMDRIRQLSKAIIPYCEDKDIDYSGYLVSNGYLFTKEVSEELKSLRVTGAQITIDGFEDTYNRLKKPPKNAFKRVLQNIESSAIPIRIKLNVTRDTTDEVLELYKELTKLQIVKDKRATFMVTQIDEYTDNKKYGFTTEEWLKFRQRIVELRGYEKDEVLFSLEKACLLPCVPLQKRNVTIGADGYLYRCVKHFGEETKIIGTLKEGIFADNETDKAHVCSMIDDECKRCKLLPICRAGSCRYDRLLFGKPCDNTKGRFRQNMQNYLKYVGIPKEKKPKKGGSLLALKSIKKP